MDAKELIRNRRLAKGLTMREVAEACGVSEATVSRWESGHIATMKQTKIALLCQILGISPAEFCELQEPVETITEEETLLISTYRTLSAAEKQQLLQFAQFLVKMK